ncbi:MAG: N-acyl-D-amino-acid deacylase family protein [Planctomycetota bacterium]|jgi:N-acyl-D-amino-acid deacylase
MYDVLILNGQIIDGSGKPKFMGDVAVRGGKIIRIGQLQREKSTKVIWAENRIVAPGFIDSHSHSDLYIFEQPMAPQKIMQGVTTENIGLDGMSVAPIAEKDIPVWRTHLSGLAGNPNIKWNWQSLADYFDRIDALPTAINITAYVGLGTIRLNVMGMTNRNAKVNEISRMKKIAAQAMEQGARGISAGLIYPPSQYQSLQEIVEIAKVVREYDGIFDVHMRNESDSILEAIQEVNEIGRISKIPVHITHFKIRGKKNWGRSKQALELLDKMRQDGLDVTMSQYPYTAGSTMLHAVIPPWYHAQGPDKLLQRLREQQEPIKRDIRERMDWENFAATVGWDNILVSSVERVVNKKYEGKSIAEVAEMQGLDDPADAALDLLAAEDLAVGMINFGLNEDDVIAIMKHPTVSFITDGLIGGGTPHPRVYGTYPRILGRYVRDQRVLSLEEAIRKMTSLPAQNLRLKTKGMIAENYDADITVFDPNTIIDNSTYENPKQFPTGIDWVIVNGQTVVEHGVQTGATPGRTIRTR